MVTKNRFRLSALALVVLLSGCNAVGPKALRGGRNDYNVAIQYTSNEQLLLNLVRLKYRDTPCFLAVSSVATSFNFDVGGGASASLLEKDRPGNNVFGLNARAGFAEKPTVSYVPLHGEDFVKQMLTPLKPDTLLLLYHSGWSVERIFKMCVQRINGVKNAPGASGPTPDYVPEYKTFKRVCKLLRGLQRADALSLGAVTSDKGTQLFLRIADEAKDEEEARELRKLLGLKDGLPQYQITPEVGNVDSARVGVSTRSMTGILFYLSQGVEVPKGDVEKGRVTVTRKDDGSVFDWSDVVGDVLRVRSSGPRPAGAYISVDYRGTSFFIDDADLQSKSSFSLLMQLLALQAGNVKSVAPTLTLPVGQ